MPGRWINSGESGFLVSPRSPAAYAEVVDRLITSPSVEGGSRPQPLQLRPLMTGRTSWNSCSKLYRNSPSMTSVGSSFAAKILSLLNAREKCGECRAKQVCSWGEGVDFAPFSKTLVKHEREHPGGKGTQSPISELGIPINARHRVSWISTGFELLVCCYSSCRDEEALAPTLTRPPME